MTSINQKFLAKLITKKCLKYSVLSFLMVFLITMYLETLGTDMLGAFVAFFMNPIWFYFKVFNLDFSWARLAIFWYSGILILYYYGFWRIYFLSKSKIQQSQTLPKKLIWRLPFILLFLFHLTTGLLAFISVGLM